MASSALEGVVASYIDALTGALGEATSRLDDVETSGFTSEVTDEAFNLCAAMVDADGRHTDDELDALIDVFGPRMPDTDLLLTRTISPVSVPAAALQRLANGRPRGADTDLGIR